MPGHFGLPHFEHVHQVAHALFSLGEEIKNAQPVLVGEGAEDCVGSILAHAISAYADIVSEGKRIVDDKLFYV